MYKPLRRRNGELYYVFDEDTAEELQDFQDVFSECIDSLIETLDTLRDAVCGIAVPDIEPFPEPEPMPLPEEQEQQNELPF